MIRKTVSALFTFQSPSISFEKKKNEFNPIFIFVFVFLGGRLGGGLVGEGGSKGGEGGSKGGGGGSKERKQKGGSKVSLPFFTYPSYYLPTFISTIPYFILFYWKSQSQPPPFPPLKKVSFRTENYNYKYFEMEETPQRKKKKKKKCKDI